MGYINRHPRKTEFHAALKTRLCCVFIPTEGDQDTRPWVRDNKGLQPDRRQIAWDSDLYLQRISCMTYGKLLNLSVSQFSQLWNYKNAKFYLTALLEKFKTDVSRIVPGK